MDDQRGKVRVENITNILFMDNNSTLKTKPKIQPIPGFIEIIIITFKLTMVVT